MSRAEYQEARSLKRYRAGLRTERGLPHHPDGSGFASCTYCEGTGEIEIPSWHHEFAESRQCAHCSGEGYVADGYRDPLLRLKYARQPYVRRGDKGYRYNILRAVCATPAWQLHLIESCVGVDLALRGAVQAWRKAA